MSKTMHCQQAADGVLAARGTAAAGRDEACVAIAAMTKPLHGQNVSTFVVDNSKRNATTRGLAYRTSKDLGAKAAFDDAFAAWGSTVQGVQTGDDWLQVGQWFLPLKLEGVAVVVPELGEDNESKVGPSPMSDAYLEGEASQIQEFVSPPSFLDCFRKLRLEVDAELHKASAGTACHPGERDCVPAGRGVADSDAVGGMPELRRFDHSRPLSSRRTTSHEDPWSHVPVTNYPATGSQCCGSSPWRAQADVDLAQESRRTEQLWPGWESARAFAEAASYLDVGAPGSDSLYCPRPTSPLRRGAWSSAHCGPGWVGSSASPPHSKGEPAGSSRSAHGMAGAAWRDVLGTSTAYSPGGGTSYSSKFPGHPGVSVNHTRRPQSPYPRRLEPQPPQGTPTRPQRRPAAAGPPWRPSEAAADSCPSAAPPAGGDAPPGEAATLAKLETRLQRLRQASKEEQRKVSKELMMQWHPDKNIGKNGEAKRVFQWLQNRRKELGIGQ